MKYWLLCWIKSSTINRMNFARENTLPLSLLPSLLFSDQKNDMSAFNITVVLSYLAGSCLKVAVSCYTEDFMFIFHKQISENMTSYHKILHRTHTDCVLLTPTFYHYLLMVMHKQGSYLGTQDIAQILKKHRTVWQHKLLSFMSLLNYFFSERQYWTSLSNTISCYIK